MNEYNQITASAGNFSILVLNDLFNKCFDGFFCHKFKEREPVISKDSANIYEPAAVSLLASDIESLRNEMAWLSNTEIKGNVAKDIAGILKNKLPDLPDTLLTEIISEIFVLRDAILHNHIYIRKTSVKENWETVFRDERLLGENEYGKQGDTKFRKSVDQSRLLTHFLGLNAHPWKVSYPDLFICLSVVDLLFSLAAKAKLVDQAFLVAYKIERIDRENPFGYTRHYNEISLLLASHYRKIPSGPSKKKIELALKIFRDNFSSYSLPQYRTVLNNYCRECKEFGASDIDSKDRELICPECDGKLTATEFSDISQ